MSEPSPPLPDLQIFVRRVSPSDPLHLVFEVRAADPSLGLNYKEFGPVRLQMEPEAYVGTLFSDLKYHALGNEDDHRKAAKKIANKGGKLFEKIFPEDLRNLLWSLRTTAASLQIVSDDPHIPWELVRLRVRQGGRWIEGPFLCEAFALTRWLRQIPEVHTMPVRHLALVIPKTSRRPWSAGEQEKTLGISTDDRRITEIPALYEQVLDAMATGDYDAWHFGSQGREITTLDRDADLWPLELDDHPLVPEDLGSEAANLGARRPLVFFNSCNIGRGGRSLAGMGGWPAALLQSGAGAFIGALWGIRDGKEHTFAQTFYASFLAGTPIGEAIRQARLSIKDGDPTWLAYTVFAHPLATCQSDAVANPFVSPLFDDRPGGEVAGIQAAPDVLPALSDPRPGKLTPLRWIDLPILYFESFDAADTNLYSPEVIREKFAGIWMDFNREPWSASLEGGVYRLTNFRQASAVHYQYIGAVGEDISERPVSVEVKPEAEGGLSGAGLMYCFNISSRTYYAFLLRADEQFAFYQRKDGVLTPLYSGRSSAIRPGTFNKLAIWPQGDLLHLFINDQSIRTIQGGGLRGNCTGVIALGKGNFSFDNFAVYGRPTDHLRK